MSIFNAKSGLNALKKKTISLFGFLPVFLFFVCSCSRIQQKKGFSYNPLGYHYQLISFDSDDSVYDPNKILWLSVTYKTQSDSVFWDSYNNLNDKFYLESDSSDTSGFFKYHASKSTLLDSVCMLIKTDVFFKQQFKMLTVPFFCSKDSVVKINFKIKKTLSKDDFVKITHNLKKREEEQIENYFGSFHKLEMAADPLGFYWIERTLNYGEDSPEPGDLVTVSYKGYYLNGRFLENSQTNFEYIYGTPDQLLKGLNYVIATLKLGENAKIILPSRLAFGENGSSNGTVPPYTPLVYEIKIINLKKNDSKP